MSSPVLARLESLPEDSFTSTLSATPPLLAVHDAGGNLGASSAAHVALLCADEDPPKPSGSASSLGVVVCWVHEFVLNESCWISG